MADKDLPEQMTRRQFLTLSLGTLAAAALTGCDLLPSTTPTPVPAKPLPNPPAPTTTPGTPATSVAGPPLPNPPQIVSSGGTATPPTTGAPVMATPIITPPTISSVNGTLETSLLVHMANVPNPRYTPVPAASAATQQSPTLSCRQYFLPKDGIANPQPGQLDDWVPTLPGPTLRVKPGDWIKITLYNHLPVVADPGQCDGYPPPPPSPTPNPPVPTATPIDTAPDCFHDDNVTNIHFHGLHVDQGPGADNVFVKLYPAGQTGITPQEGIIAIGQYDYSFQVPTDHPRGTFWYHPHNHGSSALQAANGMFGMLIVEDELFAGQQIQEYVIILHDLAQDVGAVQPYTSLNSPLMVNGLVITPPPEITINVHEVQRWRILNASGHEQSAFTVGFDKDTLAVYPIAVDGYFMPDARWDSIKKSTAEWFFIAPGNRIDLLVQGQAAGATRLRTRRAAPRLPQRRRQGTPTTASRDITSTPNETDFLQVNVVQGTPVPPVALPPKLPSLPQAQRSIPDSEIVAVHTITFVELTGDRFNYPKYGISVDGQPATPFDPTVVNECVQVDTAEIWTIVNQTDVAHPFHIHLNPFYVTEYYDPADPGNMNMRYNDPVGLWQDTIYIPAAHTPIPPTPGSGPAPNVVPGPTPVPIAGTVTFRQRFPGITGTFVMHCHILGHEDRGFMHVVQVRGKNEPACTPPPALHQY